MRCMLVSLVLALTIELPTVSAFWRMPCPSRLIQERIDPIIAPGQVSAHVHTVAGGNGFGFTTSYEQQRASTCSSCPIKQDLSAYWTPKLYFQAENGSFIGVPQAGDYIGLEGGMTVYYEQRPGPDNDKLHAFPPGFRMISGNPFQRNFTDTFQAQAVSFVCLDYSGTSTYYNGLPDINCPDGVRAQVYFPACWDGVHLDSPDHTSHMSFPETGAYNGGTCPTSHPVHMISIFYEVIYSTGDFASDWYGNKQPFVFAMGDPTGYGFHGDFVNGWDVNTLQNATDNCNDDSGVMQDCPYFEYFTDAESQGCKTPVVESTNVDGPRATLPGCNPVNAGPAPVTPPTTCNAIPRIISPDAGITDLTSHGWKYLGCGTDDVSTRTFTGPNENIANLTLESCVNYCKSQGYSYAGAEYGTQCYCGNSLPADRAPVEGVMGSCSMSCGGDDGQMCGGGAALSIYEACGSGSCTNAQIAVVGGLPSTKVKRDAMNMHKHARKHVKDFSRL